MKVVEARGVTKSYADIEAVRGLDLVVNEGEYVGILGPNGAGKSTTMSMISTVVQRTGGELRVLGMDPDRQGAAIRRQMGICPQEDLLDTELNVRQNLVTYGRYYGLARRPLQETAAALLEWMDLTDKAGARVVTLSGGLRRRLAIARSLVNDPRLLLLDEPTTGLDPSARHRVWERIRELKRSGMTMLLTTHFMEEAEQLCDRVLVFDLGRVVAEGSPRELVREYIGHEVLEIPSPEPFDANAALPGHDVRHERTAERTMLYSTSSEHTSALVSALNENQRESALVRRACLEDVYIRLTGKRLQSTAEEELTST